MARSGVREDAKDPPRARRKNLLLSQHGDGGGRLARAACGQRLERDRSKNRTFGSIEGRFGGGGIAGSVCYVLT
jgi:hypothetical protein